MDIRKLVNQGQVRPQADGRDWPAHQTLPPFSAMFPDPSYNPAPGHQHYPMPPQGEGFNGYAQYQAYQQPQLFATIPMSQDMPYLASGNSSARNSSSTVSISSTKYAPSSASSSGPATSAERRSLSDEDEDDESDSDDVSGGSTPLPPYHFSSHTPASQQVCFLDVQSHSQHQPASPAATAVEGVDHVCDDCGVLYSRAPDLRRHKASVHNDRDSREKVAATFPCEVCGQVLLSSHGYQGHMRRHYDERPFVCEAPACGKAFHDSATLARHRRTHSTEHKFECDFCGRRFKRKDNLNTHRKKHQVGGESINPNLLRKPVTRVSGQADSPPPAPQQQVPAYGELPLSSPTYQAPPYAVTEEQQHRHFASPYPQPPHHHQQYAPQQQPQQAPPYYQQQQQQMMSSPFQAYQQQQRYGVKAEDPSEMIDYRSRSIRGVQMAPTNGR